MSETFRKHRADVPPDFFTTEANDPSGTPWVIDPAAHGGHRETDLAMTRLFGGFGEHFYKAYDEAFPLADGWKDRVALHQLHPLLVHVVLFGSGYVEQTLAALRCYA